MVLLLQNNYVMMKRGMKLLYLIVVVSVFTSCATILTGKKDNVSISTTPEEADVYYKGNVVTTFPETEKFDKTETRIYTVKSDGYLEQDVCVFTSDIGGSVFLNVLFYNFFTSTDVAMGGPTKLNQENYNVELYKLPDPIEKSELVYFDDFRWAVNDEDTVIFVKMDGITSRIVTYQEVVESESSAELEEEVYEGPIKTQTSSSELVTDMNEILENLGFSRADNNDESMFALSNATYRITAVIDTLVMTYDYLFSYSSPNPVLINTDIVMTYTIKDLNEEVVLVKTIETDYSYFLKDEDNINLVFDKAFYLFLDDDDVVKMLQNPVESVEFKSEDEIIVLGNDNPVEKTIENAVQSVVTVKGEKGYGSGCIVSSDGYVVTNYHVIHNEDAPIVILGDDTRLDAEIVRTSKAYDLALLKLDAEGFTYFSIDTLSIAKIGSDVFSIGTGGDISLGQSLSKGIVSGKRTIGNKDFIQTDVTVNPGSSGGALISKDGELLGIVNAKMIGTSVEGIGFAIPVPMLIKYLNISY